MTQRYDIILRGGVVVDPISQTEAMRDVAIRAGKVAEVGEHLNPAQAEE